MLSATIISNFMWQFDTDKPKKPIKKTSNNESIIGLAIVLFYRWFLMTDCSDFTMYNNCAIQGYPWCHKQLNLYRAS